MNKSNNSDNNSMQQKNTEKKENKKEKNSLSDSTKNHDYKKLKEGSKNKTELKDEDLYSDEPNEICKNCIFWKKFKQDCYVYWYRKKYCTMRVDIADTEEYEETKQLFDINKNQKREI